MSRSHRPEVPVIESGYGLLAQAFSYRDRGCVDNVQPQILVDSDQLRDPLPVSPDQADGFNLLGRNHVEKPDLGFRSDSIQQ